MTIAACYVSNEGVVLGADSTATIYVPAPDGSWVPHHYSYAQKVFEFGEQSTVGVVLWGLISLASSSYRTLIAEVAENTTCSLDALVALWASRVWTAYNAAFAPTIQIARDLADKSQRTPDEDQRLRQLFQNLSVGFCMGGRRLQDRQPRAFQVLVNPLQTAQPVPEAIQTGRAIFWGMPNITDRMLYGIDEPLFRSILDSGKWTGTKDDLFALAEKNKLGQPVDLPLREAIDWVHASIYSTIKTMKFSHYAPACGGPIEIAVISSDRPFRWVRHKKFDEAIS